MMSAPVAARARQAKARVLESMTQEPTGFERAEFVQAGPGRPPLRRAQAAPQKLNRQRHLYDGLA